RPSPGRLRGWVVHDRTAREGPAIPRPHGAGAAITYGPRGLVASAGNGGLRVVPGPPAGSAVRLTRKIASATSAPPPSRFQPTCSPRITHPKKTPNTGVMNM